MKVRCRSSTAWRGASGGTGGPGFGGGVLADAAATLENCTLAGNHAMGGSGGNGTPTHNPPIQSNANGGNGGPAQGGALHGRFVLASCTIPSNTASGGPGGIHTAAKVNKTKN